MTSEGGKRDGGKVASLARDPRYRASLRDVPFPLSCSTDGWPDTMTEMADHIGIRDTLRVCEALGGRDVYISADPQSPLFADVLSPQKRATMAKIYGGCRFIVPTAHAQLDAARRGGLAAAVRTGQLSVSEMARVCGSSRRYIAYLVNQRGEGLDAEPVLPGEPHMLTVLRQVADGVVQQLGAAGVNPAVVATAWAAIMSIWSELPVPADVSEIDPSTADPIMLDLIGIAPAGAAASVSQATGDYTATPKD